MSETRFGRSRPPFEDAPDLPFFYETPQGQDALRDAVEFLQEPGGLLLVTGEAGVGKTLWGMVLRRRLKALGRPEPAWMHRESVGRTNLLRDVFHVFGLEPPRHFTDPRAVARLRQDLVERRADGARVVLFVDGAEQLCPADLARLNILLQLAEDGHRLLDVVLLARPEAARFFVPGNAQETPTVGARIELPALRAEQTAEYVRHRLRVAGAEREDGFDAEACAALHERGAGLPGKINRLARAALARIAAEGAPRVDARLIHGLAAEPSLHSDPASPEPGRTPPIAPSSSDDRGERRTGSTKIGAPSSSAVSAPPSRASRVVEERRAPRQARMEEDPRNLVHEQELHMSTNVAAPSAEDAAAVLIEDRLEQLLRSAEVRARAMEERLAQAGDAGDSAAERLDRLAEACDRASRVEQRLTLIAEQLADRIDHVQEQVAGLLQGVDAGENTRANIERFISDGRRVQSELQMQAQAAVGDVHAQADRARQQLQELAASTIELAGKARYELDSVRQVLSTQTAAAERATTAVAESSLRADQCRTTLTVAVKKAEDVLAREQESRTELEGFAQTTRESVQRQIEDVAREAIQANLEDARRRIAAAFDEALTQVRDHQRNIVEDADKRLRAMSEELDTTRRRAESSLSEMIARSMDEMRKQNAGQQRRIEQTASDGEQRLRRQGEELESACTAWTSRAAEHLQASERQLQSAASRIQSECVQSVAGHRTAIQKAGEQISGWVRELNEAIEGGRTRIERLRTQEVEALVQAVEASIAGAEDRVEQLRAGPVESVIRELNTLIDDSRTRMQQLEIEAEAAVRRLDADAERSHAAWQQSLQRLLNDANERRAMLESALRADCDRMESLARANVASLAELTEETVSSARRQHEDLADALDRRAESARRELAELDAYCYRLETVSQQVRSGLGETEVTVADLEQRLTLAAPRAEDIASRADAAHDSLRAAVDDAHRNLMRVGGTVAQLEALQSTAQQTLVEIGSARERIQAWGEQLRDADQLLNRLASTSDQAGAIEDTLRATLDRAGRLSLALQSQSTVADDRLSRLGSQTAAATEIVHRLGETTVAVHDLREKVENAARAAQARVDQSAAIAEACTERMEALSDECRQLCERSETQARQLRDMEAAAERAVEELRRGVDPAAEIAAGLSRQTAEAREQARSLQHDLHEAGQLADRLDALSTILRSAKELDAAVRATLQTGGDTREALESAIHEASRRSADLAEAGASIQHLLDSHERVRRDAQGVIAHLADQLESARTASGSTARLLDEFLSQSRAVAEQLAELARKGSALDQRMGDLLARPEEIVAAARQQADQLEHVCSAVRKVFTGLSRATLEARKECQNADTKSREIARRIEELAAGSDAQGRAAARRLEELGARTDQAVVTLREWVEEARRVQARLERAIEQSPSIRRTHPGESLDVFSASGVRPAVANASAFGDRYAARTPEPALESRDPREEALRAGPDCLDGGSAGMTLAAASVARRDVPLGPEGMEDLTGDETAPSTSLQASNDTDARAAEIDALLADARRATKREAPTAKDATGI